MEQLIELGKDDEEDGGADADEDGEADGRCEEPVEAGFETESGRGLDVVVDSSILAFDQRALVEHVAL